MGLTGLPQFQRTSAKRQRYALWLIANSTSGYGLSAVCDGWVEALAGEIDALAKRGLVYLDESVRGYPRGSVQAYRATADGLRELGAWS